MPVSCYIGSGGLLRSAGEREHKLPAERGRRGESEERREEGEEGGRRGGGEAGSGESTSSPPLLPP
jgi:hypothetical protein